MHGLEIVDKPIGKTSFDMVRNIRKKYNIKKVGHIGTLDPMATGVLVILIGEATKLSDYLMEHDKEYIASIHLGEKTDTGDSEGNIIDKKPIPEEISKEKIITVLNRFLGESYQVPPMYSAIKVNGEKLYNLARQGKTVERKSRKISIDEIELLDYNKSEIKFRVVCSKGTYIRVLCEDIAEKLDTLGYMSSLRRTRIGKFCIEDKDKFIELKDILLYNESEKNKENLSINIEDNNLKKLLNGVPIKLDSLNVNKSEDKLVNIYNNKKFIGIGQIENGSLKRKIIL